MPTEDIERWSPFKSWLYSLANRSPKSNRAAVDFATLTPEDRLLDIGCGPGAALEIAAAAGVRVAGVDPSDSMVSRATRRVPDADVRVGSAEEIPFPDDHFSVVINVQSFHHWADREAGLREILRVLAPGGRLHIVEGDLKKEDGHGLSPTEAEQVRAKLTELGYVDTSIDLVKPGRWRRYVVVTGISPKRT